MRGPSLLLPTILLALAARIVDAHIVPVPPSSGAFNPVTIEAPDTGVTATAVPPRAADEFQIIYDPQASQAQFELSGIPRQFTAAGVDGTFSLQTFGATLTTSGDLTATPPLLFTMNGGTASVPIALTTGLAASGETVVEGKPMGPPPDGLFTLIGMTGADPLGPPLAGRLLVVRLTCQAMPRPDTDQFRLATRTTAVSATLSARTFSARVILAPGPTDVPDFQARPAILRTTSGDTVVATIYLPAGLPARGRKLFVGRSDDGRAAIGVRSLKRSGQVVFLLALKVAEPTVPLAASAPVDVAITYDVGGLLSRVALPMRPKRHGALLRYP